ncbi:hypothetical protein FLLO111716_12490 [Flavobacterium longum]|uniref:hypothetical protein n=1 Tax=Flavobacterium longum TaxID=1299340 RepID=UPI0039ECFC2B
MYHKENASIANIDFCADTGAEQGIVGFEEFRRRFPRCHVNFDKLEICAVKRDEVDSYAANGCQKISSNFRADGIYVTILLRRKKYELKLDTGFTGGIAMSAIDAKPFEKDRCHRYENKTGEFAVFPNKWFTIGNNYYNTAIVVANEDVSRLGVGIMKGFNWIFDFDKHEVYIQKNTLGLDAENTFPLFQVDVTQSGLVITSKIKTSRQISLGDIVTKVNGVSVTSENICEMKQMLNGKANWDRVDIQTETQISK